MIEPAEETTEQIVERYCKLLQKHGMHKAAKIVSKESGYSWTSCVLALESMAYHHNIQYSGLPLIPLKP